MALTFRFGVPESSVAASVETGLVVGVACPVVSGNPVESWEFGAVRCVRPGHAGWTWCETAELLIGAVACPVTDASMEAVGGALYAELLRETEGLHLYRAWHFLPRINAVPAGGLENYRAFCRARATVFESHFLKNPEMRMPAASAVGVDGDRLVIVIVAGRAAPEHFENPEQTPAYRYPSEYGPKSPSFARATRVRLSDTTWCFISGTASIKGSETLYAGDFAAQVRVTEHNLALMRALLSVSGEAVRRRTYLRAPVQTAASGAALRSDICRADLLLEVEESARIAHLRG